MITAIAAAVAVIGIPNALLFAFGIWIQRHYERESCKRRHPSRGNA